MSTWKLLVATTLVACLTLPVAVNAQAPQAADKEHHAQRGQKKAMKLDANDDGQLSREEVKGHARLEKGFDRMDTNKDGLLSKEELEAARSKMKEQRESRKPGDAT
jgi:Ca2+-binding EF-hand superfamily protein